MRDFPGRKLQKLQKKGQTPTKTPRWVDTIFKIHLYIKYKQNSNRIFQITENFVGQ